MRATDILSVVLCLAGAALNFFYQTWYNTLVAMFATGVAGFIIGGEVVIHMYRRR